jgi:membrane-bound metal-dependent hydrolase YbcI (DUF457 family)
MSDKQSSLLPQSALLKHSNSFKDFVRSRKKNPFTLKNVVEGANSLKQMKANERLAVFKDISWRILTRLLKRLKQFFSSMTFEQKYLLIGAIMANLPDIDVILSPLFGGPLQFHRTITHSVYGNAVILPVAAFVAQKLLGLRGFQSYSHCLWLASLCVTSHIITDYITNFGTAIFYPLSPKMYSYGVVTVWDFTTVLYFYAVFTVSRFNMFPQAKVFGFGVLGFILLMIWKRAMLCEVYSKSFYFMEQNHKKARNAYIWLQPHNIVNGRYSIMKFDMRNKTATELKSVTGSPYLSLINYINDVFGIRASDIRKVQLSATMGPLMGMTLPKDFFLSIYQNNRQMFNDISKTCLPTAIFVVLYHFSSFLFMKN